MLTGEIVNLAEPSTQTYPDFGFTCTGTAKEMSTGELCGFAQKVWRNGRIQEGFVFDGWFYG